MAADALCDAELVVLGLLMNDFKAHFRFSSFSSFFTDPLFDSSLDESGDVDSEPLSLVFSLTGDKLRERDDEMFSDVLATELYIVKNTVSLYTYGSVRDDCCLTSAGAMVGGITSIVW